MDESLPTAERTESCMETEQTTKRDENAETRLPSSPSETPVSVSTSDGDDKPICLIFLGMAGSGKTSLVQRLCSDLILKDTPPYVVNLDPACYELNYPCHIDIRDTVKYKEVMKNYGLGPNGAIVTCLNLFATKFDQVIKLIAQKKTSEYKYVLFDTPGQIEVFTWSASGMIITETLASQFPTIVVYVMDTERSQNPTTFMSNMLYACSILYKTKLPFIIAMNKIDIVGNEFAVEWMKDFEAFQTAVEAETSYVSNLTSSMSLVLDEFYETLTAVGISAVTGKGVTEFIKAVDDKCKEYELDYRKEYERLKSEREKKDGEREAEQLSRVAAGGAEGFEIQMHPSTSELSHGSIVLQRASDDEDVTSDEEMEDEDENEKLELESFRKFLQEQKSCDRSNRKTDPNAKV